MKRNRGKYRSTIISIFVSIVLYMTINSFAEYSFRSSLKVFDDFNFNVIVEGQKSFYSEVIKLDNIKRYSMIKMISANLEVAKMILIQR
jgi:putative ABC transport system permease protein